MDRTQFQMKLTATAEQIAQVERDLEAIRQPVDALGGARDNARKAALGLVELAALFHEGAQPIVPMRACAACGKPGIATATRCGFCWTKIVHAATE
jgi:hypothetical protein